MRIIGPARAIGWEIAHRNRVMLLTVAGILATASVASHLIGSGHAWTKAAEAIAFTLLSASLLLLFASFHFTEGNKKGGFGSFPNRLLRLPVATGWLVGFPMLYALLSMLITYTFGARFILRPLGSDVPVVWPCVYLAFGLSHFQMIVWGLPGRRYSKLFCLSLVATTILLGWMFFLPSVVEGTLEDWGYRGSVPSFMRFLMALLGTAVPVAYLISVRRINSQRHGDASALRVGASKRSSTKVFQRRPAFQSAAQALFWRQWWESGLVLPACVAVVLMMFSVPTAIIGEIGIAGTRATILGLFATPFVFGLIIGSSFGKPNFWQPTQHMAHFDAIKPVSSGAWVFSKLKVGFGSAAITWTLVILVAGLWFMYCGNFQAFEEELRILQFYYSTWERIVLITLGFLSCILFTWELLVGGLPAALSGRKLWFHGRGVAIALLIMASLAYVIGRPTETDAPSRLYLWWPVVARLPVVLALGVLAKVGVSCGLWNSVAHRGLLPVRSVRRHLFLIALAALVPSLFMLVTFEHTAWLKYLLVLGSVFLMPWCGPPLAILALEKDRSAL